MSDSVWILGTSMTRFARHGELDLLDLASEAALGALDDGGVSVHDLDVLACGSLFSAHASVGQQLLGQIGQTGIAIYNVANACATGATAVRVAFMAIRSGEASMAMAVGVEKMGKMGLLTSTPAGPEEGRRVRAVGPLRVGAVGGRHPRYQDHARRVRAGWHALRPRPRRRGVRAVRPHRPQEPPALHAEPAGAVPEGVQPRRDQGRADDGVPQHAADVLPHRATAPRPPSS